MTTAPTVPTDTPITSAVDKVWELAAGVEVGKVTEVDVIVEVDVRARVIAAAAETDVLAVDVIVLIVMDVDEEETAFDAVEAAADNELADCVDVACATELSSVRTLCVGATDPDSYLHISYA